MQQLTDTVWTIDHPLSLFGVRLGTRSVVMRLPSGSIEDAVYWHRVEGASAPGEHLFIDAQLKQHSSGICRESSGVRGAPRKPEA